MLCPNPSGLLIINDIPLESECWAIMSDLVPLWFIQRYIYPTEIHIPADEGALPYAMDIGPATFDLNMLIIGGCNQAGSPYADPWAGLASNINAFRTDVLDPILTNNGQHAAELSVPDGSTRAANVQVREWKPGRSFEGTVGLCVDGDGVGTKSTVHPGTLSIYVPAGIFA